LETQLTLLAQASGSALVTESVIPTVATLLACKNTILQTQMVWTMAGLRVLLMVMLMATVLMATVLQMSESMYLLFRRLESVLAIA
jgi:hypothetical protein